MSVDEIREAKDELIKMSNDDTQRELYEMRAKTLRDKISALNEAERKGIKKGREEGRKEGEQIKAIEIAKSLTKNDLAIIMSNYGNYFSEYKEIKDILIQNNVPIILITLNYHSPQLLNFKDIIYLSSQPFTSVGSYPMKLFTEYLVRRLRVKYK